MGKIVNSTFVSLDGVINHMERWHPDIDAESDSWRSSSSALASSSSVQARVMDYTDLIKRLVLPPGTAHPPS